MSCPNNEATKLSTRQEDKCKENCSFNFDYNKNSSCVLTNKGDYLEIKTDGTNNVTYNSQNIKLDDVRLYIPSLHTFDGKYTDAELILKHGAGGNNVLVSVPIIAKKGTGHSPMFFSKIVPYIPSEKGETATVNVSNWSLNDVMPAPKTPFYTYKGDSPYPPCNMQATMIIFDKDHASTINPSDLNLIKKNIKSTTSNTTSGNKEGFIGGIREGFREGLVTYNENGANNNEKEDDTTQAMECTEYYDTDPTPGSSGSSGKTSNISIDWSQLLESPYFIGGIILLVLIVGFIFIKFVLPKIFAKLNDSKDVVAGTEASFEIPDSTGGDT